MSIVKFSGCTEVFIVPPADKYLNGQPMNIIDKLNNMGVGHIKTMTMGEATEQLALIQQKNGGKLPTDKKFIKITGRGEIVNLFC